MGKTLEIGDHGFPGLWATLLPEDFQWITPPRERRATCADCYRVALGEYHPTTSAFLEINAGTLPICTECAVGSLQ